MSLKKKPTKASSPKKNYQGEVRIIGGQWRGRKLPVIDALGLRPTSDRTKETLFNWLQVKLAGTKCLDAFGGSGALAMEALSRGAKQATVWETHPPAFANLKQLNKIAGNSLQVEAACALTQLSQTANQQFNLVFLDPPFAYLHLNQVAEYLTANGWLAPQALVYVEVGKPAANSQANSSFQAPANWQLLKQKATKEVVFSLYLAE